MNPKEELAARIKARYESLKGEQSNFRSEWQDCSDYIVPRKGNIETMRSAGERQTTQVFDTTAGEANNVFAAGLVAQLTPAGEIWARYSAKEDASQPVKDWLDECTQIAMRVIYGSNFYLAWHEDCIDSGSFGSSLLFVEESDENVLNCVNVPVGTYVWEENADGAVDSVYRCWEWTARQCKQKWGDDVLPERVKDALKSDKGSEAKFKVIHAVYPREKGQYMDGPTSPEKRPFASVYVIECGPVVVEEGGYYENPFACGRLLKSNGEPYGRGPGIQAMPEIKLLNRMEKDLLLALEKMVLPSWLMPDDSVYRVDNRPNGTTYYDASNPNAKPEQVEFKNRIDLGEQKTEQKRARIREAFYNSMFQMLSNMDEMKREKTAFEVAQMLQEKLVLFSPIFARIVQEKLNPTMERVFNICMRKGLFPPVPVEIQEAGGVFEYKIEYVSKIALAIRAAINDSIVLLAEIVERMAQFDPSVIHVVKWKEAFRSMAENRGIPSKLLRSDDEVEEIMQRLMQAEAAAAAPDAAAKIGKAAKDVGAEGAVRQAVGAA